jgi:hypothetical protein
MYSKPASLDLAYGKHPVSFQMFLRMRPGRSEQQHRGHRENSIAQKDSAVESLVQKRRHSGENVRP